MDDESRNLKYGVYTPRYFFSGICFKRQNSILRYLPPCGDRGKLLGFFRTYNGVVLSYMFFIYITYINDVNLLK